MQSLQASMQRILEIALMACSSSYWTERFTGLFRLEFSCAAGRVFVDLEEQLVKLYDASGRLTFDGHQLLVDEAKASDLAYELMDAMFQEYRAAVRASAQK